MKIRAILFGATGMVGEGVLHEALRNESVESVLVISRNSCDVRHHKLKELIHHDFSDYSTVETQLKGYNACYFCLGVSSIGMNEKDYAQITYNFTLEAGRTLSRLNPEMTFCYVSGAGTDSTEQGRSMWARVKGKTENDLTKLPFRGIYLFRPGFIRPTKGLRNAFAFSKVIGLFYPLWKALVPKYVCTLKDLGLAMMRVTQEGFPKPILECVDITRLGESGPKSAELIKE